MANGTNIAASKNRGCGAFKLYMDEFHSGKITISIQWDHRKARGEENSSSPINSPWNTKIPSSKRNTNSVEQQDNSTQMHDGLRTGSTAFQRHSGHGRKNQSGDSSRIPRANSSNQFYSNVRRSKRVMRLTQAELRHIRLETIEHDWCSVACGGTSAKQVERLVEAGIMKEVHYHSWLSNPVMVKKHDDSWRMCVDFKYLNKACPKDGYPLPEID
ncbi:hypothetical protein Tco_0502802 [Tanacetum coccineum]